MSPTKMYSGFLDQLMEVPSSDPDDARRRKLLNILLIGVAALSAITIFVVIISPFISPFNSQGEFWIGLASAIGMFIGALFFYQINRNPRLPGWVASYLFILFLMIVFAFTDSQAELANGRSLFIFTIPVIMASILLRPVSSFIFALLSSTEIWVLGQISGTPANLFAMVGFFLVAFISWLSARNLEQALRELRVINAELDQRVIDRTRELTESLEIGRAHV